MKKIFLNKDIIENSSLTDEGLIAYVALRNRSEFERDLILYDYLGYKLTGNITPSGMSQKLKKGIMNLQELNLIKIVEDKGKKLEVDLNNLYFTTQKNDEKFNPFIIINQDEIRTIMNSCIKFKEKLLRYFIVLIGTINNGSFSTPNDKYCPNVGNSPISYIASKANISTKTAIDYNKTLEELRLIYICRSNDIVVDNSGKIQNSFTNCYGRPEDMEAVKSFQTYRELNLSNKGIKNLTKDANYRRSMKQKYNKILKSTTYDIEEVKKIYNHFAKENQNISLKIAKIKQKFEIGAINENDMKNKILEEYHKRVDLSKLEKIIQTSNLIG